MRPVKVPFFASLQAAVIRLGLLVLIIIAAIILRPNHKQPTSVGQYNVFDKNSVTFQYPNSYAPQPKPTTAGADSIGILYQTNPESTISVFKELNADKSAQASKQNILDDLELIASRQLPLTHNGFRKISDTRIKTDGFDAADFAFRYTGKDKKTPVYSHLLIVPRGHDAFYVTIESVSKATSDTDIAHVESTIQLP